MFEFLFEFKMILVIFWLDIIYHALFLPECEVTFVVRGDKYWHANFLAWLITPENSKTSKIFRNEKQLSSPDNDAICIFSKGRLDQELSYFYIQSTGVSIYNKRRTPKKRLFNEMS